MLTIRREDKFSLFKIINNRMFKLNRNFIICIIGKVGSGKSFSGLTLAEGIMNEQGKSFNMENGLVFSAYKFINIIADDTLTPRGETILFDEMGISVSNRKYWDEVNQAIVTIAQSFRFRNLCIIITVPSMELIDVDVRKFVDLWLISQRIDFKREITELQPSLLHYNALKRKWYLKPFRIFINGVGMVRFKKVYLDKPPEKIINKYEEIKKEMLNSLYKYLSDKFMKIGEGGIGGTSKLGQELRREAKNLALTPLQKNVRKYLNKNMSVKQISEKLGKNPSIISRTRKSIVARFGKMI